MNGEYDFKDLIEVYLQQSERDISWLARQLGKAPSTVSRWYHRETRPQNPTMVVEIAELLNVPEAERTGFFTTAADYYGWNPLVFSLALSTAPTSTSDDNVPTPALDATPPDPAPPSATAPETEPQEVRGWWWRQTERYFHWSAADDHAKSSWEGMTLYGLGQAKEHITSDSALRFVLAIILFYITFMMTTPALRWAMEIDEERRFAFFLLGVAFVTVPLFIAVVTPAEKEKEIAARGKSALVQLWILKATGAWVGFMAGGIAMFAPVLVWYYTIGSPTGIFLRLIVVALPLSLSYLAARRIPVDRLKMFKDEDDFRLHDADRWFLVAGIIAGPGFAFYLYSFYDTLSHPLYGPTMILTALLLIALISSKQNRTKSPNRA